jgi:murein DD-endopeptidase MepM/ murein hydrolase activator NlpD
MSRRYTVSIADCSTGVVRQVTIGLRPILTTLAVAAGMLALPILIGLGANGALTAQIQSLETVINDLGARAALDPEKTRAMQKLPAYVKARAVGGTATNNASVARIFSTAFISPEDTFGVLRELLGGLESRLRNMKKDVDSREALANAVPSLWPAHGWLTGIFGGRSDPFTGEAGFHQGIDISTEKGQPVYATADGTVVSAAYSGDYGNLIVLHHEFGLATRYGHLSGYAVKPGENVKRGQVIGYVGATGRATGAHLHYEILANGELLNPLQILTKPVDR